MSIISRLFPQATVPQLPNLCSLAPTDDESNASDRVKDSNDSSAGRRQALYSSSRDQICFVSLDI